MKISIIIPDCESVECVEQLLHKIDLHSSRKNIQEILIIQPVSTENEFLQFDNKFVRVIQTKSKSIKMNYEIGAFESKGNLLFFMKPGYIPPPGFDYLLLNAIKNNTLTGSITHSEPEKTSGISAYKETIKNLFITKNLFYFIGGFSKYEKKEAFKSLINKVVIFHRNMHFAKELN